MKYYLGYFQNEQFNPIIDSNIGTSILDVVNFTTGFSSIEELRKFLIEKKLIPNKNCKLAYVIEKGQKGNKSYSPLKRIDNIYLSEHKNFFSTKEVASLLKKLESDYDFMTYLYSEYTIKYTEISKTMPGTPFVKVTGKGEMQIGAQWIYVEKYEEMALGQSTLIETLQSIISFN